MLQGNYIYILFIKPRVSQASRHSATFFSSLLHVFFPFFIWLSSNWEMSRGFFPIIYCVYKYINTTIQIQIRIYVVVSLRGDRIFRFAHYSTFPHFFVEFLPLFARTLTILYIIVMFSLLFLFFLLYSKIFY